MNRTLSNMLYLALGGLLTVVIVSWRPSYAKGDKPAPKLTVDDAPLQREGSFQASFAPIIKLAAPSVVNIFTTKTIKESGRSMNPFLEPLFREFFGDQGMRQRPRNYKEQSLGSGVIISSDGYILTSSHVVEGADEVRIVTSGRKEFTAKVVGSDAPTDTAVLKVDGADLPAITLADSDRIEVGDVVLAIGNPFGIGQTVTMGIVSATGRGDLGIVDYEDFIQTDASINPGNSGGALVDARGRLIGINTAILSRTGGNMGVGFAIPINLSRGIMDRLVSSGRVARGFLGVGLQTLTPELADQFELKDQSGAVVTVVQDGTPADKAGFQAGDVITEFNKRKVADSRQLRLMVSQTAPKTEVEFKVLRDGKEKEFHVALAELPADLALGGSGKFGEPEEKHNPTLDGVEVADLSAETRREYNVPNHVRGALITRVAEDSAASGHLRAGDVILEFEKKAVRGADDAIAMSEKFEGNRVFLRIWRRGSAQYLFVPVDREQERANPDEDSK